jgi:hypothetical protein
MNVEMVVDTDTDTDRMWTWMQAQMDIFEKNSLYQTSDCFDIG